MRKSRRWVAVGLLACLLLPTVANATTTITEPEELYVETTVESRDNITAASGGTFNNITWNFDESTGTLTISGTGDVPSLFYKNYPWGSLTGKIKKVVVEEGITTLGSFAIIESEMPITEVHFPSTLVSLVQEGYMLQSTTLQTITVAEGNPYYYAEDNVLFKKNEDKITLICYPGGQTRTQYTVPEGVTNIGVRAICSAQTVEITLPESLVCIEKCAFEGYESDAIVIPKNVTEIHEDAFCYCKVKNMDVDPANAYFTAVDGVLFSKDMKILHTYPAANSRTTYTVPDGVEQIPSSIYRWTSNLQKLYLSDTVKSIQGVIAATSATAMVEIHANETNPYLTDIDGILYDKDVKTLLAYPCRHTSDTYVMPNTVKTIADKAIFFIRNLKTVYLGSSLTTVSSSIPWGNGVTAVYFPGDVPTWLNNCCDTIQSKATLYYPTGNTTWTSPTMTVSGVTYNTASYTPYTAEDLTGDGSIDAEDVALLVEYFSGKAAEFDTTKADFDGDGDFDRADVMYLARALANWDGYTLH